jgi:hypothetical protein
LVTGLGGVLVKKVRLEESGKGQYAKGILLGARQLGIKPFEFYNLAKSSDAERITPNVVNEQLLLACARGRAFFQKGKLGLFETLVELLYLACGTHRRLFARVERVAVRRYL